MKHFLILFTALTLLILIVSPAKGQDPGPPAGGSDRNLRDSASDIKGRSNELERVSRDSEKPEKRSSQPAVNFEQIKDDFEQIQIINGNVLQAKETANDYNRLYDSAKEVEKRALRLRGNLFTSEPLKKSKDSKRVAEPQTLKSLLEDLDASIATFTHNAMFQNAGTVSADDSAKAQKELENIAALSSQISFEVEKLKKSN